MPFTQPLKLIYIQSTVDKNARKINIELIHIQIMDKYCRKAEWKKKEVWSTASQQVLIFSPGLEN